jgi:glycosyltransferase involved in cell wall biosynthesis
MKILHVTAYPPTNLGGLEIFVKKLTFNLQKFGIQSDIVTTNINDPVEHILQIGKLNVFFLKNYGEIWGKNPICNLMSFLFKNGKKYDIIHIHSYIHFTSLQAIIYAKLTGKKTVLTLHGGVQTDKINGASFFENIQLLLKKILYDRTFGKYVIENCTALVSVSKSDILAISKVFSAKRKQLNYWIPNAVDKNNLISPDLKERNAISFIGRLSTIKGFDLFIKIVEKVNKKIPNIPIIIVGTGSLFPLIQKNKQNLNLHYYHKIPNEKIYEIYFKTRIFLLSSRFEGFPTTILEAMSYSTPIISTDVGGITDIIKHEENGLLYHPNDIDEAVNHIVRLYTDFKLQEKFCLNSKEKINNYYNWDVIVEKYIKIYRKFVNPDINKRSNHEINFLIIQETDWLTRGPHTQHHLFERLSKNKKINITVLDYDIEHYEKSNSIFIRKKIYPSVIRVIKNSHIKVIRTAYLNIPFLRRISSIITNSIEMIKIIHKKRPSFIIGYSLSNGIIALILSKLFRIPYIFHYLDIVNKLVPISYLQSIAKFVEYQLLKSSDLVFVINKVLYYLVKNIGVNPNKVRIIYNGVEIRNPENYKLLSQNLKIKYNIKDNDIVLFFMGYLYDFAGLLELIDYYNEIIKTKKLPIKFLILGDKGIEPELKRKIDYLNADWVIYAGKVNYFDLPAYIELATICLQPFRSNQITRDIYPIKISEYMAQKKPILSTKLPGIFIELGNKAGLIYTKDTEELIVKIKDLIYEKEYLEKQAMKGYKFVIANFDWEIILKKFKVDLIEIYHKTYL